MSRCSYTPYLELFYCTSKVVEWLPTYCQHASLKVQPRSSSWKRRLQVHLAWRISWLTAKHNWNVWMQAVFSTTTLWICPVSFVIYKYLLLCTAIKVTPLLPTEALLILYFLLLIGLNRMKYTVAAQASQCATVMSYWYSKATQLHI